MIVDEGCFERGCACHDSRESPGVVVVKQPEQEPVAYLYHDAQTAHDANPLLHSALLVFATERRPEYRNETPLYTHPPRREWRGLTEEEIVAIFLLAPTQPAFARAIEAALKEKNYE